MIPVSLINDFNVIWFLAYWTAGVGIHDGDVDYRENFINWREGYKLDKSRVLYSIIFKKKLVVEISF